MLINWPSAKYKNIVFQQYGDVRIYGGHAELPSKFTDDFIAAATASFRCPKAMIEITWANSAVDQNVVIASNDINRIDRTGQLFNGETDSGQKWAYIHTGLIADGSFHVMPELDSEPQAGWYGSSLISNGSGDFSTEPYLQITHDARSYTSISIAGDSEYDEYPVDFTITYTHVGGPTVQAITGNTERVYSATFSAIKDVTVVKVEISKWSAINTIVKVTQFAGALIELYKSDDIVELNILEETNSDTGVVPIGNVSSNELDVALLNTDRRFSYGNTDSVYVSSLRSRRKIRVWLGFELPVGSTDVTGDVEGYIVETVSGEKIGYMPYGVYWSKDWISNYDSQVTTTTAYDIVYLLSQKDFLKSANYTGAVEDIVDAILTEALISIPELNWSVSAATGAIIWTGVAFEPKNYLEVLKDIAEATLSYTYVDRNGVLIVGSRLGVVTPVKTWQQIDLSIYHNYESNPKLDELINTIRVGYTEYNTGTPGDDIYSADEVFTIPAAGILSLYILWSKAPVDTGTVVAALVDTVGAPFITSLAAYAYGADIEVTGTPGDQFKITATATPFELEENTETTADDTDSVNLYGIREFALTDNILIVTVAQAQEIANLLLSLYGNVRQDGSINWFVSTLLSVGDTLEVTEFESDTVETKDFFLIKRQSIKFDGSMQGQTELRRG